MNINNLPSDEMRYRKKSNSPAPPKAKHKHQYQDCLFEIDWQELDKANGFVPSTEIVFGSYCPICGKIGGAKKDWYIYINKIWRYEYTDEAKKELDESTRTLPLFRIKDFTQKYIEG